MGLVVQEAASKEQGRRAGGQTGECLWGQGHLEAGGHHNTWLLTKPATLAENLWNTVMVEKLARLNISAGVLHQLLSILPTNYHSSEHL